jgi:hypothetical protein
VQVLCVLGSPASIMGRSPYTALTAGLRPFAVSRSYAAIIAAPLLGKREKGRGFLRGFGPLSRSAPPGCRRGCLMYTKTTSLPILYIRNIIPDGDFHPLRCLLARSGWGHTDFTLA